MRIQTKTGILFTIITASIILITSWTTYFITKGFVNNDFLKRLELRAIVATKVLFERDDTSANAYEELRKKYLETLPQEKEYIIKTDTLNTPAGKKQIRSLPAKYLLSILKSNGSTVFHSAGNIDYAGVLYHDERGDFLVIKSAVNEYGISTLNNLRDIKITTFVLAVLIVYTTSLFFARKTFEPVREIIKKSRAISAYNLGLRLEEKEGEDEISKLANTFNNMLDRLQTAFETQNNFISNASHELRTPLTNIIGEADWALKKTRTAIEYQQSISNMQQHADELNQITSDLLTLAQSSFNGQKQEWEEIGLVELINEAAYTVRNLIKGSEIVLEINDQFTEYHNMNISGNKTLLRLALGNIISNAAKYSNHGTVTIQLTLQEGFYYIVISDSGIGIPETEIKRVFEPFFRASNTGSFEGYGVGLPLALNIIRIHQGNIDVFSEEMKGTTVTVTLPVQETQQ